MTAAAAENTVAGPWDARAACRGKPALMDLGRSASRRQFEAALAMCRRCPILFGCRDWALGRPLGEEISGVCGGLTEQQRRRHRDRRFTRTCTGCGQTKPADQFTRDLYRTTGRKDVDRDCHAAGLRAYRAANKTTPRKEATVTTSALNGSALAELTGSAAEPEADLFDTIDGVIDRARRLDDGAVAAQLDRTLDAFARLRDLVTTTEQRKAAQVEIAELEARLAAAKARAKDLGAPRRTTGKRPAAAGPSPKDVRAWAKERGKKVNEHGRVPQDVVDEYLAAHGQAR